MSMTDELQTYVSIPLMKLSVDQALPADIFLCVNHKMVKYKPKDDSITSAQFDKLLTHQVKFIFVLESARGSFDVLAKQDEKQEEDLFAEFAEPEAEPILESVVEHRRTAMDLFTAPKNDEKVLKAVKTSQAVVAEFLKAPFAVNNISALQRYSKGCADHSVNVSVLSVFLGLRMGYTSQVILENLAFGGLFHDYGKVLVEQTEEFPDDPDEDLLRDHPILAADFLEKQKKHSFPKEVEMIVAQHHEFLDGTGYPKNLKGFAIYDLARLVAIANLYDNFVSESTAETMQERGEEALKMLEVEYEDRVDAKKLEKIAKIIRYSFL